MLPAADNHSMWAWPLLALRIVLLASAVIIGAAVLRGVTDAFTAAVGLRSVPTAAPLAVR
jgi:hypothetical protein